MSGPTGPRGGTGFAGAVGPPGKIPLVTSGIYYPANPVAVGQSIVVSLGQTIANASIIITFGQAVTGVVSNVTSTNFTVTIKTGESFVGPLYWLAIGGKS
jgi:hypothetical protein